ncbi:hypothetical protein V2J09_013903 [Rumex salicifolius]
MGKRGLSGGMLRVRKEFERRESELMRREEMLWIQQAKTNELKWGIIILLSSIRKRQGGVKETLFGSLLMEVGRNDGLLKGRPKLHMIFVKASCIQSSKMKNILHVYGAASGQQVSFAKSELSFSRNVDSATRQAIQQILGVSEVDKHEKYLGLPTMVGRSKKFIFAQLKERIMDRLSGWKEKCLSRAGKEILIKSIVQAIPTYIMSCFKLPEDLCSELEQLFCNFWWGDTENSKKIHWMNWKRMCFPKTKGSMGFRELESFNIGLLARQSWRLL